MTIKQLVSEVDFEALPDSVKEFYKKSAIGYELDLESPITPTKKSDAELKRALDRERQQRKDLESKLKEIEDKLDGDSLLDAKKRGDIELLEKSWADKLATQKKESNELLKQRNNFIQQQLVDSVATDLAKKLSGNNFEIMLPHVRSRLVADLDAETPITRVKDTNGHLSALSLEDLKNEFVANPVFGSIITASKASGGNGVPNTRNGVTTGAATNVDLAKLDAKTLGEMVKQKVDSQT